MEHALHRVAWEPHTTFRRRLTAIGRWVRRIVTWVPALLRRFGAPFDGVDRLAESFGTAVGDSMRDVVREAHALARDADSPE